VESRVNYNLLEQADPELVQWLRSNAERVVVLTDKCVVHEGALDDGVFVVEHGSVRIATTANDSASVSLADLGRGSIVGEMSWLEDRPAVASVWAKANSQLLHLRRSTLDGLIRECQPLASQLFRAIGCKLTLQIQNQNAWIHRFNASPQEPLRKVLILFADLDEQDVDWLRQLGKLQRVPPGGVLLNEGQPVKSLFLVLTGEARIQVQSKGQTRVVGSSRRGELLGEMSLFKDDNHGASAKVDTLEGLELLSIDIERLLSALAKDASRAARFWRAIARMLSQRSREQLLERGLAANSRQAESQSEDEEIEVTQLSGISTAGARFDWLCRQLQNQEG